MELVYIVILLALVEYIVFGALVGRARGVHGVKAPVTTGPEAFERIYRVHQNTLEALIVFVPAMWLFGLYVSPLWGAGIGVVFIVSRVIYARGYIAAAEKRGPGAMTGGICLIALVLGALIGAVAELF